MGGEGWGGWGRRWKRRWEGWGRERIKAEWVKVRAMSGEGGETWGGGKGGGGGGEGAEGWRRWGWEEGKGSGGARGG